MKKQTYREYHSLYDDPNGESASTGEAPAENPNPANVGPEGGE